MCRSVPHRPHAATSTTTSRGPGAGSSTLVTSTTPGELITAALTLTAPPALTASAARAFPRHPPPRPGSLDRAHRQSADPLVLRCPAGDARGETGPRGARTQVRPAQAPPSLSAHAATRPGPAIACAQV